ncbi:aldose 1-epimerase family protein [Ursidibacter arcticus]
MNYKLHLSKSLFLSQETILLENEYFKISCFKYTSGVEALRLSNSKGYLVVLPYYGQMIWDAVFEGHNLCMKNMFNEPKLGSSIIDTYGCFSFHSGLLCNGCPSPEDNHPLHGEFPCAQMDNCWLEISDNKISVISQYEYVKGFGHHYLSKPSVVLYQDSSLFNINLSVTNLSSVKMPLQYMCHMNYCYEEGASFEQNIPEDIIELRESIPAHVIPTPKWLDFNNSLKKSKSTLTKLTQSELYDPEIVFFMDNLSKYQDKLVYRMISPKGHIYRTEFSSDQFNYATRWVLYNADQQVAAFVLPATCRPEGFKAAQKNNSLIFLNPYETKEFSVLTGIED